MQQQQQQTKIDGEFLKGIIGDQAITIKIYEQQMGKQNEMIAGLNLEIEKLTPKKAGKKDA